jgi:hypothetical protein
MLMTADIFGKLRVVQWNGFDFTLSLIRWGILRRYRARRGKITFFDTGALFIPKYEIAVYEGAPAVVYSEAPEMVFYYPDKASALVRLGDLESAIANRPIGATTRQLSGECRIEQVEAVFDRGEARLRHWNRLAGL